jgi:hypothetical protein
MLDPIKYPRRALCTTCTPFFEGLARFSAHDRGHLWPSLKQMLLEESRHPDSHFSTLHSLPAGLGARCGHVKRALPRRARVSASRRVRRRRRRALRAELRSTIGSDDLGQTLRGLRAGNALQLGAGIATGLCHGQRRDVESKIRDEDHLVAAVHGAHLPLGGTGREPEGRCESGIGRGV